MGSLSAGSDVCLLEQGHQAYHRDDHHNHGTNTLKIPQAHPCLRSILGCKICPLFQLTGIAGRATRGDYSGHQERDKGIVGGKGSEGLLVPGQMFEVCA